MNLTHVLVLLGLFLSPVDGFCAPGFESLGDFCYAVLHVRASWAESQNYCEALGASLAVIEDQGQELLIDGMITRQHNMIKTFQIWIGGTDLLQEGVFVAPKTLEPLTYFNWAPKEPDNLNEQHCLAIFRDDAGLRWDDNKCEVENFPLCQRDQVDNGLIG